jgi:hypothetical protein
MTMVFAILCVSHRGKDTIMSSVLGSGTAVRHFHRFASKGERFRFHLGSMHALRDWMPATTHGFYRQGNKNTCIFVNGCTDVRSSSNSIQKTEV